MKNRFVIIAAIALLAGSLTSCTTINPYTGEQEVSRTTMGTAVGAAGGAILGSIVGGGRGALIGAAAGGVVGGVTGNYMDNQNTELRRRLVGTGVQITKSGNYIRLNMSSDVTFRLNSANINYKFYDTLRSVAIVLKRYNRTNIIVAGFTDNTGTKAYNQRLSERRGRSVASFLINQGINPNRVFTRGYGQRHPIASNRTAWGRRLNRRVVITLRPIA